jgi:hypothetical protein
VHGPAIWIAEHLRVFNNAAVGIWRQMQHNVQGQPTYLLGHTDRRAIWYYFPVALSMKLTIPLLALMAGVLFIRPRALWSWTTFAALCLLVFSLNCRVQIGIRLVLPIIALLAIATAVAWVRCGIVPGRRWLSIGCVSAALAFMNWSIWTTCPDGIGFINEMWGGPVNGYRLLSDSNSDWGQGLNDLAAWQRQQQLPVLDVWYFGTDPRVLKPPFHVMQVHTMPITNEDELRNYMQGRYLAVGTSVLFGGYCQEPSQQALFHRMRNWHPIARTSTFLIYDLKPEQAEANRGTDNRNPATKN